MFYRDIIKTLVKRRGTTIEKLAHAIGLKSQAALSQRLKDSWNPGMADCQELLDKLGYEIAFVPKGMVSDNRDFQVDCFVPEFPEKQKKEASNG